MAQADKVVVIVGGGFGGLNAARALRRAPVNVLLLDRDNYYLFQPLLYQVATAGLERNRRPVRAILRKQKNFDFRLVEVHADFAQRRLERAPAVARLSILRTDPKPTSSGSTRCSSTGSA